MTIELGERKGGNMKEYHKIQTVYKRNPETKFKTLLEGEFSLPELEYLANNQWEWTEKIDGTNIRVHWDKSKIYFGGRTENAQIPAFLFERLQELFFVTMFQNLFPDVELTLYGEGYGLKIQKGGGNYICDGVDFVLFDVYVPDNWLERCNVVDIGQKLGIRVVPVAFIGTIYDAIAITKEKTRNSAWGDFLCEGFVGRPKQELRCRNGNRVITKIKHKDFL